MTSEFFQELDFVETDFKKPGLAAFILALKDDDEIRNFLLVGDDIVMDLSTSNFGEAIYYLLCYYYCFNLNYPEIYNEFLVAFQIFCFEQSESVKKRISFKKFENEVENYLKLDV